MSAFRGFAPPPVRAGLFFLATSARGWIALGGGAASAGDGSHAPGVGAAGLGADVVESAAASAAESETAQSRSARGPRLARADAGVDARAPDTAANANAKETAVLVETLRDDEPEGIFPRERLRAHLESDVGIVAECRVSSLLHDAQDVHRAHDAIHERARDGGVRVVQEIVAVGANSPIEVPVVLAVPPGKVGRELPDVLIVLLAVVRPEAIDEGFRVLVVRVFQCVYGIPFRVIPVPVGVALILPLCRFSPVAIKEVRRPRDPFRSPVR